MVKEIRGVTCYLHPIITFTLYSMPVRFPHEGSIMHKPYIMNVIQRFQVIK